MKLLRISLWLATINFCIASYLDYPRIHFSGKYFADVNTINNYHTNFKASTSDDELSPGWNPAGGNEWSLQDCTVTSVVYANGTKTTDSDKEPLIGASVVSNPYSVEGKLACFDVDAWNKSALFGITLGVKYRQNLKGFAFIGKLLSNSVIHQNAWYQVPCDNGSNGRDVYGARSASKLTDVEWDSVLDSRVLQQLKDISNQNEGHLSIGLVMFDFSVNSTVANFAHGQISGSIGYSRLSEPRFIEGERLLSFEFVDQPILNLSLSQNDSCNGKNYTPVWAYKAPFKVHAYSKTLTVDFSSAFTRNSYRTIRDLGTLYLGILNSNFMCVDKIGAIDYQEDKCRSINGCIMDFKLSNYHFDILQHHQLVLVMPLKEFPSTNTTYPICRSYNFYSYFQPFEHTDIRMTALMIELKYFVRPFNHYSFILEKGDIAITDLIVTYLGRPAIGRTVLMKPSSELIQPNNGLNYNKEETVNCYGYARFVFRANSIKYHPRKENDLDGQVYLFMYSVKGEPQFCTGDVTYPINNSIEDHTCIEMVTIKVYSDISYDHINQYIWVDHVQSIFKQYVRVYPAMKRAIDLSNYNEVTQPYAIQLLNYSMQLDINHPNYMPVSRDLSLKKRNMILEWLARPCYNSSHCFSGPKQREQNLITDSSDSRLKFEEYMLKKDSICNSLNNFYDQPQDFNNFYKALAMTQTNDQTVDCITELENSGCSVYVLRYCLQKAVELEFYTIPLYLTALYSIKDNYNTEVKSIIRSIVMQEMLHMLQAANLLISIGGRPVIDNPNSAPVYPATGLPGGVLPHLTVSLKKLSLDQIYAVFMAIEYPHKVIDTPLGLNTVHAKTIGQLYSAIKKCFDIHGDTIFYPNRTTLQVKWPYKNQYGNVYVVYNLPTAMEAIKEITEQGEGAQPGDPHSYDRKELAHFFKFQEIICGRKLVFNGVSNYTYTGDTIPFDDRGVWPMRDNPSVRGLNPQSLVYARSKVFHQTYRSLLRTLDNLFSGDPHKVLETVAIMESLEVQAKYLLSLRLNNSDPHSETCGPIFDYFWNDD